jgi:hypothetical protein
MPFVGWEMEPLSIPLAEELGFCPPPLMMPPLWPPPPLFNPYIATGKVEDPMWAGALDHYDERMAFYGQPF